ALQAPSSQKARRNSETDTLRLGRNFLHSARLAFAHPLTGQPLELEAPLPEELQSYLRRFEAV
ncbi:MAG: RluA family pseudouridine synthase, partial [Terracidiphilus sp.]